MDGWWKETRAKSDNYGGKKTPLTCEIENKQIKTKIRLGIKKKETPHTSHKKERKMNIGWVLLVVSGIKVNTTNMW